VLEELSNEFDRAGRAADDGLNGLEACPALANDFVFGASSLLNEPLVFLFAARLMLVVDWFV